MNYRVSFLSAAKKQFEKLPQNIQLRIYKKIKALSQNPRPHGVEQLTDFEIHGDIFKKLFRIRIGDYRLIYSIEDEIITISIIRIKHRKEVYK